MTSYCRKPGCNARSFIERTEDGVEAFCLSGHRYMAEPITPLDIPKKELDNPNGIRGPRQMGLRI